MNLKIDCKNVKVECGAELGLVEVEIIGEDTYEEQLEHYIDYLSEKYGQAFIDRIKDRFNLEDINTGC